MKIRLNTAGALVCVAALSFAGLSAQAQNLLTDPGFELGITAPNPNPTGIPGWAEFAGASILTTPLAHGGSNVLYTPDSGGGYSVPGAYQAFAASPGETFTLSGWVYTPNVLPTAGNDFAILQLNFFTGAPPNNYAGGTSVNTAGVNVGQPAGGGGVALPQGVWTYASVTGTAGAGVNSLGVYLLDINADAHADFYFDDISLTVVPEPSSFALAGLGLLGLMLRRRK